MFSYLYNPPILVKRIFHNFAWESSKDKVLFSFDDGPNPGTTEIILTSLKKKNIKALFFLVGENILRYPELVKNILEEGHEIGNHTMRHSIITKLNKNERREELGAVQKIMAEDFGYKVKFFRPPHGRFPFGLADELIPFGLKNVMWSLLTYDFKNELSIVKKTVDNYLKGNSIIVFHDSNKSAGIIEESINYAILQAEKNNFVIGGAKECLS